MEESHYENNNISDVQNNKDISVEIIMCNLNKDRLDYIMDDLLHHCDLFVYGYNKFKDEYWAKTKNNQSFLLKTQNNTIYVSSDSNKLELRNEFYIKINKTLQIYEKCLSSII
jgi:hypothetical protein